MTNVEPKNQTEIESVEKAQYNQFITALDMAQLKKVALGIRGVKFDAPKHTYMKAYDDFLKKDLPQIMSNVKMRWVAEVIDSRIYKLTQFTTGNWGFPKELEKEFEKTADYIEKVSNVWKR